MTFNASFANNGGSNIQLVGFGPFDTGSNAVNFVDVAIGFFFGDFIGASNLLTPVPAPMVGSFHEYQIIWTDNCVRFLIDDVQYALVHDVVVPSGNDVFVISDSGSAASGPLQVASVEVDLCTDIEHNNCQPNVFRKQCESQGALAVFTPYPHGINSTCLSDQPCLENCGTTDCFVSAFVVARPNGDTVIEYFVTGAECGNEIGAIVISAINNATVGCAVEVEDLECVFISAYDFFDAESSLSSSDPSSSTDSLSAEDGGACTVTANCGDNSLTIPISPGFRGVEVRVPAGYAVGVGLASFADQTCDPLCEIEVPVPQCITREADDDDNGLNANGAFADPAVDLGPCDTPSAVWLAANNNANGRRVAARAWDNAVEVHWISLVTCSPASITSSVPLSLLYLADPTSTCSATQCNALLVSNLLTTGVPPHTVGDYVTLAMELLTTSHNEYTLADYTNAIQSACCAEFVLRTILAQAQCSTQDCSLHAIYPGAGSIEAYEAILIQSNTRKRAPLDAMTKAQTNAQQAAVAGQQIVAFEECGAPRGNYVPDNDMNDAVFTVSATSMVDATNKYWQSSSIHVTPLALGSTHDFALDMRFGDSGLPNGAVVRVVSFGLAQSVTCYTVNSPATETVDCPSTTVARLIRSLRAALPQHVGAATPFINTLQDMPMATIAHMTSVFITMPPKLARAPTLRYSFDLHDRASACVVQTSVPVLGTAFGVIVPAPFAYALEGVPAYINASLVPSGGICVGGDNSAARCADKQECEGGYCELHGANAYRCFDSPLPGINAKALCSRQSQCPYGRCYGHDDSPQQNGAYPALAEFLRSRETVNGDWFRSLPAGQLDRQVYYDAQAHLSAAKPPQQ